MYGKTVLWRNVCFVLFLALATGSGYAQDQKSFPGGSPTSKPQTAATPRPNIYTGTPTVSVTPKPIVDIVTPEETPSFYGRQGVLVETAGGGKVMEQAADASFNPASAVKLATALDALHTFGPGYRFATAVWTTGEFDRATNTVRGDLIVSGRDPSFNDAHAITIARELNDMGVRVVTGDLIVSSQFSLNYSPSPLRSGERFYDTLDATRRPASATRAWQENRHLAGDLAALAPGVASPSVAVMGAVYVGAVPAGARVLVTHKSSTLTDILKILLCYSNNFMAERLGDAMGGAAGLERFLVSEVKLDRADVRLASTSGLGINRLSPRSMMKIYRTLVAKLAAHNLKPSDILPVAGVDPGTLQKRFTSFAERGSVIAKTGTLVRTDGGASALVGQTRTASGGTLYFVIFNQRGGVWRFRGEQDRLVARLQNERGGPLAFAYAPRAMELRLIATELTQTPGANRGEEFEPDTN